MMGGILLVLFSLVVIGATFQPYDSSTSMLGSSGVEQCIAFCNGDYVVSYNNTCEGVFSSACEFEGMNVSSSCIGSWEETISDTNKVALLCDGLYFGSVDGDTYTEKSSCGGVIELDYFVESLESFSADGPVNTTCTGNYMSEFKSEDSPNAMLSGLSTDDANITDGTPPGFSCNYTCGDNLYNGYECDEDFALACDYEGEVGPSKFTFTCSKVFVGDWSGSGCVGSSEVVDSGAYYVYSESCSEQRASSQIEGGEEIACHGTYSTTTAVFE